MTRLLVVLSMLVYIAVQCAWIAAITIGGYHQPLWMLGPHIALTGFGTFAAWKATR